MPSLGSLGVVHDPPRREEGEEPETFDWFGDTIRITSEVNDLDLIDYLDNARNVDEAGVMALAYIKDGLRLMIDPEDFDRFWRAARQNFQTIEDLTALSRILMEGTTGRPTQQPSDSSAGRLETQENSEAGSSSPPVSNGRPDLQIIHDDSRASFARIAAAAASG